MVCLPVYKCTNRSEISEEMELRDMAQLLEEDSLPVDLLEQILVPSNVPSTVELQVCYDLS